MRIGQRIFLFRAKIWYAFQMGGERRVRKYFLRLFCIIYYFILFIIMLFHFYKTFFLWLSISAPSLLLASRFLLTRTSHPSFAFPSDLRHHLFETKLLPHFALQTTSVAKQIYNPLWNAPNHVRGNEQTPRGGAGGLRACYLFGLCRACTGTGFVSRD